MIYEGLIMDLIRQIQKKAVIPSFIFVSKQLHTQKNYGGTKVHEANDDTCVHRYAVKIK